MKKPARKERRAVKKVARKMVKDSVKKAAVKKRAAEHLAVLFDTETTGLVENRTLPLDKQPEIIELYACAADLTTGEIRAEVNFLCRPRLVWPLPDNIVKITGIASEMVESQPNFSHFASSVFKLMRGAPRIVAHNASFDRDMLEIEAERLGQKVEWGGQLICTVEQTVHLLGYRLTLSKLYQHLFEEKFEGAHRAKVDVAALLRCCVELRKRGQL